MAPQNKELNPLLISHLTVRKAIGFMAISLPAILIIGSFIIGGCTQVEASVSHYYYTVMGDIFVGFLVATGVLLISYKGYDAKDNIITFITGICALCIAVFPTSNNKDMGCAIRILNNVPLRIQAHYISAALFYILLSCISLFIFTKSSGNKTKQKTGRNKIYRVCGIMILVSILLIFLKDYIPSQDENMKGLNLTFWLEWVANLSYGISWLVKGGLFLKDK